MTRHYALAMVAFTVMFGELPVARAYRTAAELPELQPTTSVRWHSSMEVSVVRPESVGLARADVDRALQRALRTWRFAPCELPQVRTLPNSQAFESGDGRTSVVWLRERWSDYGLAPNTVGTTDIVYRQVPDSQDWEIVDADILLNGRDFSWTTLDRDDGNRAVDAVVAHELGHAFGLLHPCEVGGSAGVPTCTDSDRTHAMYPGYLGATHLQLSADDAQGVCSVYGHEVIDAGMPAASPDAGVDRPRARLYDPCGAVAQCSEGVCREGFCREPCDSGDDCDETGRGLGEPCQAPEDCGARACLSSSNAGYCTRRCDSTRGCPSGYACGEVGGERVCRAESSPGCSASGETQWNDLWIGTLFVGVFIVRRRYV